MKKIIFTSLILLGACGRQADLIKAPKKTFEKRVFAGLATDVESKKFEQEARDITILMYPNKEDVRDFSFSPSLERQASWEDMKAQLSPKYLAGLKTEIPRESDSIQKVADMVTLINTAGEIRDNKYRQKQPLLKEQKINEAAIDAKYAEFKPAIDQALAKYSCFYKARPARGQKWDCRSVADATYKSNKKPSSCAEMDTFTFVYSTPEDESSYTTAKQDCLVNQDALTAATAPLKQRNNEIDLELEVKNGNRDAAKSVVMDLLEAVEKATGEIFVSAASSLDKKLDCPGDGSGVKCISKLVFGDKNQTIEEFVIYADFGVYSAEKLQTGEYSLANGGIQDLKLYTDKDGVRLLEFKLVSDLVKVKAKLSMTVQDDMKLRFVGETDVFYKNGVKRRGVMKLEFNEL